MRVRIDLILKTKYVFQANDVIDWLNTWLLLFQINRAGF